MTYPDALRGAIECAREYGAAVFVLLPPEHLRSDFWPEYGPWEYAGALALDRLFEGGRGSTIRAVVSPDGSVTEC